MSIRIGMKRANCLTCQRRLISRKISSSTATALFKHDQTNDPDSNANASASAGPSRSRSSIFTLPIFNPPTTSPSQQPVEDISDRNSWSSRPLRYHRRDLERARKSHPRDEEVPQGIYDRMVRYPKRRCIVTRQELPSSFLINLRPTYIPPTQQSTTSTIPASLHLLPDRVASPARVKKGKGFWVTCHRNIIDQLTGNRGPHVGLLRQIPNLQVPPNLRDIIHGQLIHRAVYELDLLSKRLKVHTRRVKNRASSSTLHPVENERSAVQAVGGTEYGPEEVDVVFRRLTLEEADRVVQGDVTGRPTAMGDTKGSTNVVALLDIMGLGGRHPVELPDEISGKVDIPLIPFNNHSSTIDRLHSSPTITQCSTATALGTASHGVPLYPLGHIFPADQHQKVLELINSLLTTEAMHKRRSSYLLPRGTASIGSSVRNVSDSHEQLSNILTLHYMPRTTTNPSDANAPGDSDMNTGDRARDGQRDKYSRGELGSDLAIALWRIRCFLGQGWEAQTPARNRT
ncbi:hypothetical protein IAT40_002406 [Kwoniella sp. CBS 6097]